MDELWQRLKQRKLVQWSIGYIAAAFSLIQGIDVVASQFGWPESLRRGITLALTVGFFVMLVIAWFHGERGAQRVSRLEVLLIVLVLEVGGVAIWHYEQPPASAKVAAAAKHASPVHVAFNPPADSIVVLPFANLGGDKSQQYFSDGITEELTGALGQNTGLTVIAWDTASQYRNGDEPPLAVGKALNVANLLHGSIQREGDAVRVIAELVNTRTGAQVWSDHYDDSLKNIFQVQDKISAAIADALKVKFASLQPAQTVNPQAHDLVLQAVALMDRARTAAPYEQARQLLEQAIALDPDYAEAHALLAHAWFELTQFSTLPLKDTVPKVYKEAKKALALDPNSVLALIALANIDVSEGKFAQAKAEYQRAIELDPSNAFAHLDYGTMLPLKQTLAETLEAAQLDPDNATAQNNLVAAYQDLGQYAQALPPGEALLRLDPRSADNAFGLALDYALLHRNQDAVKAFDLAQPDTALGNALAAAGKLAYQSALDPKLRAQALVAADALRKRPDLDPFSLVDVIQLYLVLDKKDAALALLPQYCAATPVGCSDFSVNPVWQPLHGNPAFEALVKKYDTASQPVASATSSSP